MTRCTIGLIFGLFVAPLCSDVQTPAKIPCIGIIKDSPNWRAFRKGLSALGYVEGQNIAIEWRFAEGKLDRLAEAAMELVGLEPDIIVTIGALATRAAMQTTTTLPIVADTRDVEGPGVQIFCHELG
jgi:putative tryptophan/tyrosine transport system substrate-binding protein